MSDQTSALKLRYRPLVIGGVLKLFICGILLIWPLHIVRALLFALGGLVEVSRRSSCPASCWRPVSSPAVQIPVSRAPSKAEW